MKITYILNYYLRKMFSHRYLYASGHLAENISFRHLAWFCVFGQLQVTPPATRNTPFQLRPFLAVRRQTPLSGTRANCTLHRPLFNFTKSVWANANNLLIMSPTSSTAGKHLIYLREDIFHCKLMLLNREREKCITKNK